MESLTKYHLDRIKTLARQAAREVQANQMHVTGKRSDVSAINFEVLTNNLLLIGENVRMIKKIEKIDDATSTEDES